MLHSVAITTLQLLLAICFQSTNILASPITEADTPQWPNGLYGLPMADTQTACPTSWQFGTRYQDTESLIVPFLGGNKWSSPCHLGGELAKLHLRSSFCMKTDTSQDPTSPAIEWGKGKYCVMKKGTSCPNGFDEGSVQWDDEDGWDNSNSQDGELPEGVYDTDTLMYFCCREDGTTDAPLNLPTEQPFILFMKEIGKCQSVPGMLDSEEWFEWDGENDLINFGRYFSGSVPYHDDINGNNHKIYFCYYYPSS